MRLRHPAGTTHEVVQSTQEFTGLLAHELGRIWHFEQIAHRRRNGRCNVVEQAVPYADHRRPLTLRTPDATDKRTAFEGVHWCCYPKLQTKTVQQSVVFE